MNYYNQYLLGPLVSSLTQGYASSGFQPDRSLMNSFADPMNFLGQNPFSLNQKRQFAPQASYTPDLSLYEPSLANKKVKTDLDSRYVNLLEGNQATMRKTDDKASGAKQVVPVIALDDDEDDEDCVIIDPAATKKNCNPIQTQVPSVNQNENQINALKELLGNPMNCLPNFRTWQAPQQPLFNPLYMPQNQPISLFDQLKLLNTNFNPSLNKISLMQNAMSMNQQPRMLLDNRPRNIESSKPHQDLIVIDNDEDSNSTCHVTPLTTISRDESSKQSSASKSESTLAVLKKEADESTKNSVENDENWTNISDQYAIIPPLQNQKGSRITRKIKSVWNPDSVEDGTFGTWIQRIEKAVGVDISSEESVLKTMKDFNMDIELAIEKIKRNKAHYKSYFRVRKIQREYTS